ncbi:MAG: DUF47 family protein [Chitinophagales bacterium]|nr:DUF47 family protein [Chitinophagales bacterium]
MKIRNFFHFFQPKDKVFFSLFGQICTNLVEMAGKFKTEVNKGNLSDDFLELMKAYEHKNDDYTHTVYDELNRNFITPFDREDIQSLVKALDDIADYIYESTEYIVLYKAPYLDAYSQFAEIILEACKEIQTTMSLLQDFKDMDRIKEACIRVNALENEADRLLSKTMVKLFETNDAINIFKTTKVLENLELATDQAETVAYIIQGVMIKYS